MGKKDTTNHGGAEVKLSTKSKKIHVEIAPINWENISTALRTYNKNPNRVTPAIKPDHLVNDALNRYLSELESAAGKK